MNKYFFLFFLIAVKSVFAADIAPMLIGGIASVTLHETGHALAAKLLGADVQVFAPYPLKVHFENSDGSLNDKWVLGLVKYSAFSGEDANKKAAFVAAMGSGFNMLSVFILAPLLPHVGSDFSKTSLDSTMLFSCFDLPAYVATDILFGAPNNDWSKVSKLTGVSLGWYFAGGLIASLITNEYRYYWHRQAFAAEPDSSHFQIGLSTGY